MCYINSRKESAMKIMIVTDLEGVAGVLDFANWCSIESPYYDKAKKLLTLETNAAIEGFFAAGATEIRVVDGHGPGAIDPELLDERVALQRGAASPIWPFTLDSTFDAIAWVGQHAMSRTPYSHISHTGTFDVFEATVNGLPVGEFGEFAFCAAELNVPVIFASGEEAFAREAAALA
jgi:D-amino peptidase